MSWEWLVPVVTMIPAALILHWLPTMRTGTYFAVHVPDGFRESSEGAQILRSYRTANLLLSLTGFAIMLWALEYRVAWGLVLGPLLHSFGMIAAMQSSRKRAWPYREPSASATLVAELGTQEPVPLWAVPLLALPILILAGSAWYLSTHWSLLPDSFPVHWGINGQPNRWVEKSFKGVYGILLIGGSVLLLMYAVLTAILFGARRTTSEIRMIRATFGSMLGILVAVSSMIAAIALHPLSAQPDRLVIPFPAAMLLPIGLLALSLIPMVRARNEIAESSDHTPDECWRMGNYYVNPDDPALMIRNRIGFGYSPNFGHPLMKFLFPLLVVQLFATVIYVTT